MSRQQLKSIRQIAAYEQRVLDDCVQAFNQEQHRLEQIQSKIEFIEKQHSTTLMSAARASNYLQTAENRNQYSTSLTSELKDWQSAQSEQENKVEQSRAALVQQRARVKAMEALAERLQRDSKQSALQAEYHEITDLVTNQYLRRTS